MISILLQLGQESFPPGSASCHEGGLTNCISVLALFVFLGPLSSYVLMAHSGSDLRSWWLWPQELIFAHSSLLSAPLAQPSGWVLSLSLSVRPELSACPLAWAPLALVCAVLAVLGASLRHLAGHLRADHWRQSLGSTVTSHSDHRR